MALWWKLPSTASFKAPCRWIKPLDSGLQVELYRIILAFSHGVGRACLAVVCYCFADVRLLTFVHEPQGRSSRSGLGITSGRLMPHVLAAHLRRSESAEVGGESRGGWLHVRRCPDYSRIPGCLSLAVDPMGSGRIAFPFSSGPLVESCLG